MVSVKKSNNRKYWEKGLSHKNKIELIGQYKKIDMSYNVNSMLWACNLNCVTYPYNLLSRMPLYDGKLQGKRETEEKSE